MCTRAERSDWPLKGPASCGRGSIGFSLESIVKEKFSVSMKGIVEFYCEYSYLRVNRLTDMLFNQHFAVKRKILITVSSIHSKTA